MDSSEKTTSGSESSEQDMSIDDVNTWSTLVDAQHYETLGFLQMCIERRFHQAVGQKFQEVTGLKATQYWIHSDVGGSPKMEAQRLAPDYCRDQGVKIMGWSAHGTGCGGFGKETPDSVILQALISTLHKKPDEYPGITHYGFFAVEGDKPEDVKIWYRKIDPKPESK
jgi:hypothetical protein